MAAASGEADPYTIGQVLAGQTNGGVITSTTYHGGLKVPGFPHAAAVVPGVHHTAVPHSYAAGPPPPLVYGKREAEPYTVGQIAHGAHIADAIHDGRAHNVGVVTNAAIAPATHVVAGYAAHPYAYAGHFYGKREAEAQYGVFQLHNLGNVYATNPVHAVAHTAAGLTHSSNVGVCTNFVGAQVPC